MYKCGLLLLGVMTFLAAQVSPARAESHFRLISTSSDGKEAVIQLGVHTDYSVRQIEVFAHKEPARHNSLSSGTKGLLSHEGLSLGKVAVKPGTHGHTVRVPLAKLAKYGIKKGDSVFLAATWPTGWNKGVGHQWGALQGLTKKMKDYSFVVGGGRARKPAKIDVNRATADQLRQLPRIGKVRAAQIVSSRPKTGYKRYTDLRRIRGFGPKIVNGLRGRAIARQR